MWQTAHRTVKVLAKTMWQARRRLRGLHPGVSRLASALILCAGAAGAARADVNEPTASIWLAPLDNLVRPDTGAVSPDFMRLFQPGASWGALDNRVKVFKLYPQFVTEASDADLRILFQALEERGILLSVEEGALTRDKTCGHDGEGYGGEYLPGIARRIISLGGHLSYLSMDEPLSHGHVLDGPVNCRRTPEQLAVDAAKHLHELKEVVPNVIVGDIEPSDEFEGKNSAVARRWISAFAKAYGAPLGFLHIDVLWMRNWRPSILAAAAISNAESISFGIIYNGRDDDDDADWGRWLENNYTEVEALLRHLPEHVIFQSWRRAPSHVLPASSPLTFTGSVGRYFQPAPMISCQQTKRGVDGVVLIQEGVPINGASVVLEARGSELPLTQLTLTGVVPDTARTALFALRANSEASGEGVAEAIIGLLRYRDASASVVLRRFRPDPDGRLRLQGDDVRLVSNLGEPVVINTPGFAVNAGNAFTATVERSAAASTGDAAYLAVVFLDEQGLEVQRVRRPINSPWIKLTETRTKRDGTFAIRSADISRAEISRVRVSGTGVRRSGSVLLFPLSANNASSVH